MHNIAIQLKIGIQTEELGHRYHVIASQKKIVSEKNKSETMSITQGRNTEVVAAACLYMACRIKKSPYLLIDF